MGGLGWWTAVLTLPPMMHCGSHWTRVALAEMQSLVLLLVINVGGGLLSGVPGCDVARTKAKTV